MVVGHSLLGRFVRNVCKVKGRRKMTEQKISPTTIGNPRGGLAPVKPAEGNLHLLVDDSTPWEEIEMELVRIKERYRL